MNYQGHIARFGFLSRTFHVLEYELRILKMHDMQKNRFDLITATTSSQRFPTISRFLRNYLLGFKQKLE